MRIAQVVTYISPDGAFGGPVRVALGQAEALASRGHEVTVYAAAPGTQASDVSERGYRLRTFPAKRVASTLGFAGMFAPGLTRALKADLPSLDVAHVHLARDLVTLPAARAVRKSGVPLVLQPHGMIDRSRNPLAWPIDVWEVRSALRQASAVLTLTERESEDIRGISAKANVRRITNGILVGDLAPYQGRDPRALFLARLHTRKRPQAFVNMARELDERGVDLEFVLAGPDEGEAPSIEAMIESLDGSPSVRWIGPVDPARTDQLLQEARVYVLPSVGEVFPMSILEAFRAGTPVVATTSLGIAAKCAEYGAAILTNGSPEALADAVQRIVEDPALADELRTGALRFLKTELSIESVVDSLLETYSSSQTGDVS